MFIILLLTIKHQNLYNYNICKTYEKIHWPDKYLTNLKKEIKKEKNNITNISELIDFFIKLYEKGYSALNIFSALEDHTFLSKELSILKKI